MLHRTIVWFLGAGLMAGAVFAAEPQTLPGENPNPIHFKRPPVEPFSAMARLGRDVFYDTSLSSSGKMACASCHSPDHAYGPPTDGPVMLGGAALTQTDRCQPICGELRSRVFFVHDFGHVPTSTEKRRRRLSAHAQPRGVLPRSPRTCPPTRPVG